jgi:hypothetical protein
MNSRKLRNDSKITYLRLAAGLFCVLFLSLGCAAETLAEYRASINSAADYTSELLDYADEVLEDEGEKDAAYERELVSQLRKSLPLTDRVEWAGSMVETNNQWLEAKLKAFEEETADWGKRRLILTEIDERLAAIESKIDQLEKPATAAGAARSKDEDKQKLAEILRRPEYQKPAEPQNESWFQSVQRRINEWLDRQFPRPKVPEGTSAGLRSLSVGLQILIFALALGFIAFLIYRFAPYFAGRFGRREKDEKAERVILGEKLGEDEDAQTLFDEAEALARNGEMRAAIRKGYIALLCELSDRRLIGLAQHKTNRDYLRDVRKKPMLHENMNGLTTSFERHWYGFETADENDWQEFKNNYLKAVNDVN